MKSKKFTTILIVVQLIISVIMAALVFKLNVLPTKYLVPFVGLLAVLLVVSYTINRRIQEDRKSRIFLDLIIFALNIALVTGNYYFYRSYQALSQLTVDSNTQSHTLNLRVLYESEIESVADLAGKVVEYSSQVETYYNGQYLELLGEKVEFEAMEVATFQQLTTDLYDGKCDAIILDEAYEGFMEVMHPQYQDETKVIDTFEYQEAIEEEEELAAVEEPEATQEPETQDPVAETPAPVETPKEPETPVAPVEQKAVNDGNSFSIFISGIDTYGAINTVSRSDVNMVMTVNTKTNEILLTSIPRDYYVTLHSYGVKDKFTHAGIYGIKESLRTAQDFLNIDIEYYMRVNFTSLINIVDALGGISIYNGIAFSNRGFSFPVGQINMGGAQALVYARERYAYANGDNQRIKNQQTVLAGILNKAMSPAILTNYDSMLNVVMRSCQTSVPTGVVTSIIKEQLNSGESWHIRHQYLSGSGSYSTRTYSMPGWNLYVMIPNKSSISSARSNINLVVTGKTPNL